MPRAEEFDAFYAHTRSRLLHHTYALTGDLGAAAVAMQAAFAHAWVRWRKLRTRDPGAWVRHEAARLATLRHHMHLRPRLDEAGTDTALLAALQALPMPHRRLLLLQTLAGLDLPTAAREAGVTESAARSATETARASLTASLSGDPPGADGGGGADLQSRLDALRTVSDTVALPRAVALRRQGRRGQRRGTVVAVTAAAAVVVAAGALVTQPPASVPGAVGSPQGVAASDPPSGPEPPGAAPDQLLVPSQLSALDREAQWELVTDDRAGLGSLCQPGSRAAHDEDGFVRAYRADSAAWQGAVQTVQVSADRAAAVAAYRDTVSSYAGCQEPQLQLVASHVVERRGGAVQVLSMRSEQRHLQTVTVAVSRSGVATTSLVHAVDTPQEQAPRARSVARTMSVALDRLCPTSGGSCGTSRPPEVAPLPPTGEGAGFLGVVDLPPVTEQDTPWVGTEPVRTPAVNPAATLCDRVDVTGPDFVMARSRIFVMPESRLPQRFGLSETIAVARGPEVAEDLVTEAVAQVRDCADRVLSARVSDGRAVGADGVDGHVWEITYEVTAGAEVSYRLGLVRVAGKIAEVSFSGTEDADIDSAAFTDLVLRAAERLRELPGDGSSGKQ